jgi:hypothetical protein
MREDKVSKGKIFSVILISTLSLFLGRLLTAQVSEQDRQKATDMYMKLMAVTENHDYLKQFVGKWDVKSTMWGFPGTPPSVSRNSYEWKLIMGGRFIMAHFSGTMMGQPFEGLQIIGYDNYQEKYISFWIDNTSTGFFMTTGTLEATRKIMTETGDWPDAMTGGTIKVRAVTKIIGPDEFVYEMFMQGPDGKEFQTLKNEARRKK